MASGKLDNAPFSHLQKAVCVRDDWWGYQSDISSPIKKGDVVTVDECRYTEMFDCWFITLMEYPLFSNGRKAWHNYTSFAPSNATKQK